MDIHSLTHMARQCCSRRLRFRLIISKVAAAAQHTAKSSESDIAVGPNETVRVTTMLLKDL